MKSIWIITEIGNDKSYGVFTTKSQAIGAIELWTDNGTSPYEILTSLKEFKARDKRNECVFVRVKLKERIAILYVSNIPVNNGANFMHLNRWGRK